MNETSQPTGQTATPQHTLPLVRAQVKDILTRNQAFLSLPADKRQELARDMVKVAHYIVGGSDGTNVPTAAALAGIESAKLPDNLPRPGKVAGEDFKAAAAQQGGQAMQQLVREIDFPKFVAGLIDGVFNAIVNASIKQMEAYAELVKNVAKSVDQYMKDNISENQARDYLGGRYPDFLEVDIGGEQPRIKPKEGHDENNLPDFFADLGLAEPVQSLDEETAEQLVPFARRQMAMNRQELLANMVLMGINRLVVTNGSINAAVLFRLDTTDLVRRGFHQTAEQAGGGWKTKVDRPAWWGWFGGTSTRESEWGNFKVSTTQDEDSEAKSKLHAELSGKVNLNFKSETFPLEKMVDIIGVGRIQEKVGNKAGQMSPPAGQPGTQRPAGK